MTKIKLCGLSRPCDIEAVNQLKPEYIGFIFAPGSRRYVSPQKAAALKKLLDPSITAVGVFVNERPGRISELLNSRTIDAVQLHGNESEDYIRYLRTSVWQPIIKAFRIDCASDCALAQKSCADYILLDSGSGGTGTVFDWELIQSIQRPYFLAGGLGIHNISAALSHLNPYAVDVSSGIETEGLKDKKKMAEFVSAVRKESII